ncbi:hypothetical protein [Pseudonocardia sp.]|uniref:hypothetical protein n=1 Tax=Pseudonocardia sp. TaxID=60912 RepID=UPI00260C8B72|nr:hypothetical protein [Pseudonocardia sp.]
MPDELTAKIDTWLTKTGYPLEMRVAQRLISEQLGAKWEREPNVQYTDLITGQSRETDYYLDWWEDGPVFEVLSRIVIECKSTAQPWVVFRRPADHGRAASLFDARSNLTYYWQQKTGQLSALVDALESYLEGRLTAWPLPGYSIDEAFKGAGERDVAYNAVRQAVAAGVGVTTTPIWDDDHSVPGYSTVAPIVLTTSPLFEAQLSSDGQTVVSKSVTRTSVRVELPGLSGSTRVIVVNEKELDTIVSDCRALERYLPEFARIFSPELIKVLGEAPFRLDGVPASPNRQSPRVY